jgi:hypothetical protein
MPLTKATLQSTGPFGNPDQIGYINPSFYDGTGSLCILPVTNSRFDATGACAFGSRAIFFYRFLIPKPTTISGVSLAFTANTATTKTLTSITESSGTATATSTAHGFVAGDRIRIAGATPSIYNGTKVILTAPTADTFTFAVTAGTGSASGTITAREFVGCSIYDYDASNLLPKNKLVDCAILPSTSNVITNFDSNITLPARMCWVGFGCSRNSNNNTFATIVQGDNSTSMVNSLLFGEKTGAFSQFRGGVGVFAYDNVTNPPLSDGNSGHAASLTAGLPANQSAVVGIASNASAGSDWRCKVPYLGLVVV